MNSWRKLACYPRGNFYPLSDGPSIRYHRITKSDFRPCSTCTSRSQALLCFCTRRTISNRAERTFERLRYSLGGGRPSQTAHLTMSPRYSLSGLELQLNQGGISLMTHPQPKSGIQRLPPMLRKSDRNPKLGYSKAPRGLSVLVYVIRVFTDIPISPSLSPRQRSCCYAFRAGRNLPDKEFRYLRTVIVTAAVHWRFGLTPDIISSRPLTFQHWAGISPYTSPYGFAETCVFVKQSQEPGF